jgi:hypothetical protein
MLTSPVPPGPPAPVAVRTPWSPKRVRTTLTIASSGALALTLVAALVIGLSVKSTLDYQSASERYITAYEERTELAEELNDAAEERAEIQSSVSDDLAAAESLLSAAEDGYVGGAEKAALIAQRDALAASLDKVAAEESVTAPEVAPLPSDASTDELNDEAQELEADIDTIEAATPTEREIADTLSEADDGLATAGDAFIDALPAIGQGILDANGSATNVTRIALKTEVKNLSGSQSWNELDGSFQSFVASAKAVQQSQGDEEAQKAGPLYDTRKAIEAYARSVAGGAAIDFDWAPIVNGYGSGGSMAGTSDCKTDTTDGSFYSTITLTDSVASMWTSGGDARALVTHEVGHSITCKCWDIFEANAGGDYEAWATAWAIGMGFEEEGNGTQAYGRPSDALIQASKACR